MLHLHSVGHFHPPTVMDNAFLESLDIGTNDAWIMERVGIRARHTVLPLDYIRQTRNKDTRGAIEAATMTNAETGAAAAKLALERAGLKASDIGMVLCGSCSPDEVFPAEANRVAEKLGIDGPCVDLFSACSTFASQLYFLEGMRPEKLPDYVLLVSPENNTKVVDYNDRSACVLWGDASTAAIVSPRVPGKWKITETTLRGDPSGADKVKAGRFGHFIQQGAEVQKFAIKRTMELYEALRGAGEAPTFVGHQANLRMLEVVARRCEIPEGKHLFNVDRRGNVGGAGAPSVISENWDSPNLGDSIALCVVGSGLTWAGVRMERA